MEKFNVIKKADMNDLPKTTGVYCFYEEKEPHKEEQKITSELYTLLYY